MDWQPIETIPADDRLKRIRMSDGSEAIAPSIGSPPTHAERLALAKAGHWPDHRGFTPTAWMYADDARGVSA